MIRKGNNFYFVRQNDDVHLDLYTKATASGRQYSVPTVEGLSQTRVLGDGIDYGVITGNTWDVPAGVEIQGDVYFGVEPVGMIVETLPVPYVFQNMSIIGRGQNLQELILYANAINWEFELKTNDRKRRVQGRVITPTARDIQAYRESARGYPYRIVTRSRSATEMSGVFRDLSPHAAELFQIGWKARTALR